MAKLKVFGGNQQISGKQMRVIVAATSKKAAAEALDVSTYEINTWYSVTGNTEEINAAMEQPGVAFARPLDLYGAGNTPFQTVLGIKLGDNKDK